jgi:SAM-dependent methyltransferase
MNKLSRLIFYFKKLGFYRFIEFLTSRFYVFRLKNYKEILNYFSNKSGIELGGSTEMFCSKGTLPIYDVVRNLDSVNFAGETVWEGKIDDNSQFKFNHGMNVGKQFIRDGVNLNGIKSKKYNFAISSNAIEHFVNPIKAVKELIRVTEDNGLILLVLPNKLINFDHKRPITNFIKIKEIYENNISEDNLDSLNEISELHDLNLDPLAGTHDEFMERSKDNFLNRCLHHHVYDINLLKEIFNYIDLEVIYTYTNINNHIILGKKPTKK